MIYKLLLFVIPIIIFSCKGKDEFTDQERIKVTKEVKETLNKLNADVQEKGILAELNYLDSTADFFWAPPGYWYNIKYDSVVKILRTNATGLTSVINNWDTLKITPLTENYASYNGRMHSITTSIAGKTLATSYMETGIMVKRKGGWKILSGQTSILQQ